MLTPLYVGRLVTEDIMCVGCSDFRSGKSSIQKVVFHKMSPHETLFLESTNEVHVRGTSHMCPHGASHISHMWNFVSLSISFSLVPSNFVE